MFLEPEARIFLDELVVHPVLLLFKHAEKYSAKQHTQKEMTKEARITEKIHKISPQNHRAYT